MDDPQAHPNQAFRDAFSLWRSFLDAADPQQRPSLDAVEAKVRQAIEYDPHDPSPRFLHGVMQAEWWMRGDAPEGTFERAKAEYEAGLAQYKDDPFDDRPARLPDDTAVLLHTNLATLLDTAVTKGLLPARTLAQAYEHYSAALAIDPDHRMTQALLGGLLTKLALNGQADPSALEYAETLFRRVLDIERDNAKVMHQLASLLQNLALIGAKPAQALVEAEQLYREAMALEPEDADHVLRLGLLLGVMANNGLKGARAFDEAVLLLRRAIEIDPDDPEPYMALASLLTTLHNHDRIDLDALEECRGLLDRARALRPDDPRVLTVYAMMITSMVQHERWDESNLEQAEAMLRHAIKVDPGNAGARSLLARVLLTVVDGRDTPDARLDEGEALLREALELDHDDHQSRVDLANLLMALHQNGKRDARALDQAERLYMGAIDALPNDAAPRYCLANLLARMADQGLREKSAYERAEVLYNEAAQIDPDDVQVRGNHAMMLLGMVHAGARGVEALDRAHEMLTRSIEREPEDGTLHLQFSKLYNEMADMRAGPADARAKSLEHARRAYELIPEPTIRHVLAASCLYATIDDRAGGQLLREAADHWQANLEANPDDPGALVGLGVALSNLVGLGWEAPERLDEGAACFRRVIETTEADAQARFQLATILLQRRAYRLGNDAPFEEIEQLLAWLENWSRERKPAPFGVDDLAGAVERIRLDLRLSLATHRRDDTAVFQDLLIPTREAYEATRLMIDKTQSGLNTLLIRLVDRGAIDDPVAATAEAESISRAFAKWRPASTDHSSALAWVLLGGDGTASDSLDPARREEGVAELRRGLAHPRGPRPLPTELELRCRAYMHDHANAAEHLAAIRRTLATPIRTVASEHDRVVRTAGDHPQAEWLGKLAEVCCGRVPVEELDAWPAWRQAAPS